MRVFSIFLVLLAIPQAGMAGNPKEYPITLELLETKESISQSTVLTTKTNCTESPGANRLDCTSRQNQGVKHISLVSVVKASDGNTYEIECVPGLASSIFSGAAEAGQEHVGTLTTTYSGCSMPPGIYKARWVKGGLKLLVNSSKGKAREMTFSILGSRTTKSIQEQAIVTDPIKTQLNISSSPTDAEIELDGHFVGNTPSSIMVDSGQHIVSLLKRGFIRWERELKTSGGEVRISAELDQEKQ